jgi:hypothetical protein
MKLSATARLALTALFLAATLPMHADDRPARPKAEEETWTSLYKDTLDDFRIYFRGQGYIDDVHSQNVFLAEPGRIHVTRGTNGLIVTKVPYSHYHVKVDYRWGEKGGSLNAGLMTHVDLESKVVKDNRPRSIEINMRHDSPGSIWMASGLGPFGSCFVKEGSANFLPHEDGGVARLIDPFKDRNVYGNYPDGKVNANPQGEWNTLEAIVRAAESVEIIHNGHVVLRVHDIREVDTATKKPGAPLDSGGIGLQSEGQEVFYRNFLIRKLEH